MTAARKKPTKKIVAAISAHVPVPVPVEQPTPTVGDIRRNGVPATQEEPRILQLPPTRRDKEIALKETELKFIQEFAGGRHQNTSISRDERLLLAILYTNLAINPWSVSQRVCRDLGIPFNPKEFEIDIVKDFVRDYLDFGLPVDREGRGEVKDILQAYFSDKPQDEKKPEANLVT